MAAFSTIMAVVSTAFSIVAAKMQKDRAKKAAKYAADDANRAANVQFTVEATVLPLAIPYGRCKIGGVRTLHVIPPTSLAWIVFFQSYGRTAWGNTILDAYRGLISGAVDYTVPSTARNAVTFSNTTLVHDNSKVNKRDRYKYQNEVLILQQAICVGGINQILYAMVDQKPWETVAGVHINAYCDGGVVDPLIAQQGYTENLFINTAYATGAFLLDREQAQFGGAPDLQFLIEGLMVRFVERNDTQNPVEYNLSYNKSYSNNPALCLLDYLTDSGYGLAVSTEFIDLESFFNAMIVCETVVIADVEKNGQFWAYNPTPRHVKRFECNLALDSETSLRDNITKILESMDLADLIWSAGKYKLQLKYPVAWSESVTYAYGQVAQWLDNESLDLYRSIAYDNITPIYDIGTGALNSTHWEKSVVAAYLTDENIMRGKDISLTFPNAQSRYNRVTIKFRNESKEFADDTVSWPNIDSDKGSIAVYTQFLDEDNNTKLETEIFAAAVTDYWHAMAKAEQICRGSRAQTALSLSVSGYFSYLEPGDIFHLTSYILNSPGRLFRVNSVKVQPDNTLDIESDSYDARFLAWNILDDEPVQTLPLVITPPLQAINLSFSNNILSWGRPNDSKIASYEIRYTITPPASITLNTYWLTLGEVSRTAFAIPSTLVPGTYTFTVISKTPGGQLSEISGWPTVVGVVTLDYSPPLAEPDYINVTVYARATAGTAPAIPVGGTFSFSSMGLSSVPINWLPTIPGGTDPIWQSIGIAEYYPGDATYDMTDQWQQPSEYNGIITTGVSAVLVPTTVNVLQNSLGVNINYDGAIGSFQMFLDGVEISDSIDVNYSVVSSTNCTVTINNTAGAQHGDFAVVSLTGSLGSAILRAVYDGNNYDIELSVTVFLEGYIPDLSVPPTPDLLDIGITTSFMGIQVVLDAAPDYTEGNGHGQTNVYYTRVPIGSSVPLFATATKLASFPGLVFNYPDLNTRDLDDVNWLAYDYYFWLSYTTRDGIESDPSDESLINFDKIGTEFLEDNAVTQPISAHSFSSMSALTLPSTDFGGASVLVVVNASGLLVNTTGESADMEIRRNSVLIHTVSMLVGSQQIGSIPMASGSFNYLDSPGSGSHEYELTVVGLDSILYQSISVIGLKK